MRYLALALLACHSAPQWEPMPLDNGGAFTVYISKLGRARGGVLVALMRKWAHDGSTERVPPGYSIVRCETGTIADGDTADAESWKDPRFQVPLPGTFNEAVVRHICK